MKKFDVKKFTSTLLATSMLAGMTIGISACNVEEVEDINQTSETEVVIDFNNISAKDDFYGYVNGELLSASDITWGYKDVGAFGNQYEILDMLTQRILEIGNSTEDYEYGSKEDIIRRTFKAMVASYDEEAMVERRKKELPETLETLEAIKNAKTSDELMMLCIENRIGLNVFLCVDVNPLEPNEYEIDVITSDSILGVNITDIKDWVNSVTDEEEKYNTIFKTLGYSPEEYDSMMKDIELIAVDIAWATDREVLEAMMMEQYVTNISYDELNEIFTNVSVEKIEQANEITSNPYGGWNSVCPEQLKAINDAYAPENLETLRNWAVAEYIISNSDVLSLEYEGLPKYSVIGSDVEIHAANDIAQSIVLEDVISQLYVELAYDEETDQMLRSMVDDIIEGYRNKINSADWLTSETKRNLILKLDNIVVLSAKDVDVNKIDKEMADCITDDYWESLKNFDKLMQKRDLEKIGQTTDRNELAMPMHMVNAAYSKLNTVTITLAIQSAPFFSKDASYAANLGGLGAVIAHEIGHGFDSNCLVFDMNGKYNPEWLDADDMKKFEDRNKEAIEYFETAFNVYNIYTVDGELTLGENYADLGGIETCVSLLKNEAEYKEFFENYATIWAQIVTVSDLKEQIKYDVHSPEYIRVNAVLASIDEFYEVYDIKEGDGMYIAPEKRIGRWN